MPTYFAHKSAVIDPGSTVGVDCKVWHFSHIMKGATLGERCNIGQNVVVSPGVILGNNVKVQNNVSIYEGVTCDDDVFLGPSCVFTNIINPRSAIVRKGHYARTHVGKGASIIGAGAVVTNSVPPFALFLGNPAHHAGWMSVHGHRLHFDSDGRATCPEGGEPYRLTTDPEGVETVQIEHPDNIRP